MTYMEDTNMWKGFAFFLEQGWKYDKKYVIWLFLLQLVSAATPIASALLPKMVIDELMALRRPERLPQFLFSVYVLVGIQFHRLTL